MTNRKVLNVFWKSMSITLILFLILTTNVKAANFAYKDFNYEEFAKETANYWGSVCEEDEDTGTCVELITKNQKKYYTRLYSILAKYEERGLHIDDKTIIVTSFFEYGPEELKESSSYNLDNDDISLFSIDKEESADYYLQERDTIKLLVNAMIGYERICYGVTDATSAGAPNPTPSEPNTNIQLNGINSKLGTAVSEPVTPDTEPDYVCSQGLLSTINNKAVCLHSLKVDSVDFTERFLGSLSSFFGIKSESDYDCSALASSSGFEESYLETGKEKKVIEDGYWKFLVNGDYFDNKKVLRHYYNVVLSKTNKTSMNDLTDEEKEQYADDIKRARSNIVQNIKSILGKTNEKKVTYTPVKSSSNLWWPIGSNETTSNDGKLFASGEPAYTFITSKYGMRRDPVTESYVKLHTGIDIAGDLNETNIIAVKDGTVVRVINECVSGGEYTCGGNAGNSILIMHTDGMYTFYGHIHENTIIVEEGESVSQGQVIGKVGSSGWSNGPHLHFEVRTGPSNSDAVDPIDYVDPENPRPSSGSSISKFIAYLEGGGNTVICIEGDIPTVGPGITLKYNVGAFAAEGIMLTTSYSGDDAYKEYCGQSFDQGAIDRIYDKIVQVHVNAVKQSLSKSNIELAQHQIDALASLNYNTGNINGFAEAYEKYTVNNICDSWWHEHIIMRGSKFEYGLRLRRKSECHLYTTGDYDPSYGWNNR